MNNNILEVKNLHVVYRTDDDLIYALNGVDLDMPAGKTLGLVGETGAGKSTLALSIMRILQKNVGIIKEGTIMLDGIDILSASEAEMRKVRGSIVSMIFQDPMTSLNPVFTIGEQISETLRIHSDLSEADVEKRTDEMLNLVGISPERKHEYPHQFSGGMKQRVMIAIALACNPRLLIADEPTTAIDVTIQAQILMTMKMLKEKFGMAMLLITHDLGIVAQTCDYVAIMYAGEIVEYGTVEDIFSKKIMHPYTEGLFNSIPNLREKARRLQPIDGMMPYPTSVPKGCKFCDRCPYAEKHCSEENPPISPHGTHLVRCFRYK